MYCTICGQAAPNEAKFCSRCGHEHDPNAAVAPTLSSPTNLEPTSLSLPVLGVLTSGQLGLRRTFWLCGVLPTAAAIAAWQLDSNGARLVAAASYCLYQVAFTKGLWRAAKGYLGPQRWVALAKVLSYLSAVLAVVSLLFALAMATRSIYFEVLPDYIAQALGGLLILYPVTHLLIVGRRRVGWEWTMNGLFLSAALTGFVKTFVLMLAGGAVLSPEVGWVFTFAVPVAAAVLLCKMIVAIVLPSTGETPVVG